MFTTMSLQLPTHILLELVDQLKRRGGTQDLSEAINGAVQFWLADQKKQAKTGDPNGLHGYQWKCLFLPEGTVLRSCRCRAARRRSSSIGRSAGPSSAIRAAG